MGIDQICELFCMGDNSMGIDQICELFCMRDKFVNCSVCGINRKEEYKFKILDVITILLNLCIYIMFTVGI